MMTISDPLRAFAEKLPSDWQLLPFEAMLTEPVRNGIYKTKEFHGSGVRVVNMGELFGFDFISEQEMKRVELTAEEVRKSGLNDGDLLFARRSLVLEGAGKCSLVVNPPEAITFESSIIRARPNRGITEPRFLFYLFSSPLGRAIVASIATRTAVSGIRGSDLMQVGLPLPPLRVQRRIASILSIYDELIENNQTRIRILEDMARSLYREWFVHFRYPGHETVPLVDSPLGQIPQGWEVSALGDFIQFKSGFAFKSGTFTADGEHRLVTIKNVQDGSFNPESDSLMGELPDKLPSHCVLNDGDILLSLTGNVGRVCLVYDGPFYLNQRVAKLVPNNATDWSMTYCMFRVPEMRAKLEQLSNGVAQQNLSPVLAAKMDFVKAPRILLDRFAVLAEPMIQSIVQLYASSKNLRRTRNLLLPRLLSGQIFLQIEKGQTYAENN